MNSSVGCHENQIALARAFGVEMNDRGTPEGTKNPLRPDHNLSWGNREGAKFFHFFLLRVFLRVLALSRC